jgi:2-polyprenyl-6-methoxyphenol hydroxylase-like FAD-dependent oxidoreductase
MLASGLDSLPLHRCALGSEGDVHYLVFPREGGVARLYIWHGIEQAQRFAGPDRQQEFLDAFRLTCLPIGEEIAAGEPAGPCAKYPMNDTWTDQVAVPGVVLIGDAAGYNDAIIGQGLSITLRDARTVAETLTGDDDWTPHAFDAYAGERAERMRRLRLCAALHTDFRCTFTEKGRAHRGAIFAHLDDDPLLAAAMFVAAFAGPEAAPPEAFDEPNLERIRTLA